MAKTEITFNEGILTVRRMYSAPIEEVFEAWIETSKLKQWWGCAECTNVESEVQPMVGGKYNHHMTIENEYGKFDTPGFATLTEYDPPNGLAYTSNDNNDPMVVTVRFTAVEGGTEVVMVQSNIPDTKVQGDIELSEIVRQGWSASFGKLATLIEGQAVTQ